MPICLFISYLASILKLRDVTSLIAQRERTKAEQISRGLNKSLEEEKEDCKMLSPARNGALLWIIGSLKKTRDMRLLGKWRVRSLCIMRNDLSILSSDPIY